jgi:hypothetical protein
LIFGCIVAINLSVASLTVFFSAAADVLCAAFNDSNGVYMADAGRCFANDMIFSFTLQIPSLCSSGRVIEHINRTRDVSAGAEVASIVLQRFAAVSDSTERKRA